MAVPKFYEFFRAFLVVLQDGELHKMAEVRNKIAIDMDLSDSDLAEMLPSGKQTTFSNRVAWARTYLNKAGLIITPSRATYQITDAGKAALDSGETIDLKYLDQIEGFREFHSVNPDNGKIAPENDETEEKVEMEESPMELFVTAFNRVNNTLAAELMDEVMQLSPTDFESLVVQLLLKMGYGDGIDNAGKVTRATGDGGIDGMIKEDQLGFSYIYIQAKQWAPDRRVDRPEIQKFAGALQGEKATKGLFITTARFSTGAKQYAENLHGSTIVLIDGTQLMKLMIKFNVGVSVDHVYEVKRIDTDFFNEGL